MDLHLIQKPPVVTITKKGFKKVSVSKGIFRLSSSKTNIHYIYFKDTLIDKFITDILTGKSNKREFASYDISLPSFFIDQKPGVILCTRILFDASLEKKYKFASTQIKKLNTQGKISPSLKKMYRNLRKMKIHDLFRVYLMKKKNGMTCPRNSTFFPIVKKNKGGTFSMISCLHATFKQKKYYYLPIRAPIDRGAKWYPKVSDGHAVFFLILNVKDFVILNKSVEKYIKSFKDIKKLEGATNALESMPWCLSYGVDGLDNFTLIYDRKRRVGRARKP